MPSHEYQQRVDRFFDYQSSAQAILDDPALVTPEHPYVEQLRSMLAHAAMGVIDRDNGIIYTEDTHFESCVTIVPTLPADTRGNLMLVAGASLCQHEATTAELPIGHLGIISGECHFDDMYTNPLVLLSSKLMDRTPFIAGVTLIHELDHAFRYNNRSTMYPNGFHNRQVYAQLEVSAYRLEECIIKTHDIVAYETEYEAVTGRFKGYDFRVIPEYKARDADKYRRSVRNSAFVNYMLNVLGLRVDHAVSKKALDSLKHQGVVY